jgi:hypothetical protein
MTLEHPSTTKVVKNACVSNIDDLNHSMIVNVTGADAQQTRSETTSIAHNAL